MKLEQHWNQFVHFLIEERPEVLESIMDQDVTTVETKKHAFLLGLNLRRSKVIDLKFFENSYYIRLKTLHGFSCDITVPNTVVAQFESHYQ